MLNIKPTIYKALKTINGINVSEEYPDAGVKVPAVTYTEEENSIYKIIDGAEDSCRVIFRIDIWNDRSTSDIAIKVNEVITSLGLQRTFCKDAPIPSKLKHKVMRFEGIIDIKTLRVYQK